MIAALLGSLLQSAGRFIAGNWRWLAPLATIGLLCLAFAHLRQQRDDAIDALADYRHRAAIAGAIRQAEIDAKATRSAQARSTLLAAHTAEIDRLRKDYETRIRHNQDTADRTAAQWRERVRLEVARNAAYGVPGLPVAAADAAGDGADSDAATARLAYATLATACGVTTADYNALRQAWDEACEIYGCQP